MSSDDDEFPDNNSTSSGDDPSIDDPNWAANIVERAIKKAELEKSSASTGTATTEPSNDVTSPPREIASARYSAPDAPRSDDPRAAAVQTVSEPEHLPMAPPARADSVEAAPRHFAGTTAVAETDAVPTVADATGDEDKDDDAIERPPVDDDHGIRIRQLVEWIVVIVGALVVALVIKAFLIQPFYIPSGSMSPTLNKDDRILVNKLSYDLHEVNRGDIVVFDTPENFPNPDIDNLVKRVIALEGETINFSDGRVVIDDRLLEEPYIGEGLPSTWTAGLPPGCISESQSTKDGCTIPEGHVFVMGDNRTGSDDGRVFGPIPEDLIVGRAFLRVWPISEMGFL